MDQKQHLSSEDGHAFADDAENQLHYTLPRDLCHSCRNPWLRYYLQSLRLWTQICFLTIFVLAFTSIILMRDSRLSASTKHMDISSHSPALEAIEYEGRQEHATDHGRYSIYSGPPSSEQDKAWDRLVRPILFSASREEMVAAGESWEDAADLVEGGYLASLGVYHELHCLRQLRLFLYKERYHTNLTEDQYHYLQEHLDRCIETVRLTVMCKPDTGMYTFAWQNPPKEKPATRSNSKRMCVNWNALEEWSYSRMVPKAPGMNSPTTTDDKQRMKRRVVEV